MPQEMKMEKISKEREEKRKPDMGMGGVQSLYAWKRGNGTNRTGIPDGMREKFESLYGTFLGDVRVHYGSARPAALSARAYTQGSQVFLGPGEETCLPHELGHVIQQKKGAVRSTGSVGGLPLNDDPAFERQADRMQAEVGAWTAGSAVRETPVYGVGTESAYAQPVVQRMLFTDIPSNKDLTRVTDLAIWWAMAAEWHEQGLRARETGDAGAAPAKKAIDYIESLENYVPGGSQAPVPLERGDEARMLTHGMRPSGASPSGAPVAFVQVQGQAVDVNQLVTNIESGLAAGGGTQQVIPAYCYMGNNTSDHKDRTKRGVRGSSLGQGPILAPASRIVSLDEGNQLSFTTYLQAVGSTSRPWKDIIDEFGYWRDLNDLCLVNAEVKRAKKKFEEKDDLELFLEILYKVIKPQYEAFLADLRKYDSTKPKKDEKVLTGEIPGLWPRSQKEAQAELTKQKRMEKKERKEKQKKEDNKRKKERAAKEAERDWV